MFRLVHRRGPEAVRHLGKGNDMNRIGLLARGAAAGLLAATGAASAQTLTIGMTTSQTGSQNVDGTNQMRGFEMWRDDVNKAGGIKAGGKSYQVRFVSYDDQSANARVQQLYAKLITDDKAD